MIVRDIGIMKVDGIPQTLFVCATGDTLIDSSGVVNGEVLDTLDLGRSFEVAAPVILLWTTIGATSTGNRRLSIDAKLQTGASSGTGGMTDYSTQFQPATRNYFSTALTSDMKAWSTGAFRGEGPAAYYDLRPAARYVRPVFTITKQGPFATSTAASSIDLLRALPGMWFGGADELPHRLSRFAHWSTDQATST